MTQRDDSAPRVCSLRGDERSGAVDDARRLDQGVFGESSLSQIYSVLSRDARGRTLIFSLAIAADSRSGLRRGTVTCREVRASNCRELPPPPPTSYLLPNFTCSHQLCTRPCTSPLDVFVAKRRSAGSAARD